MVKMHLSSLMVNTFMMRSQQLELILYAMVAKAFEGHTGLEHK